MSSENTATKWPVGCIVVAVIAFVLCGGAAVLLVRWSVNKAAQLNEQIAADLRRLGEELQFASQWSPPDADAGPDDLFPEKLGGWSRTAQDDAAVIPELALERDGWHAVYQSGESSVDLYAYRLPAAEQSTVFSAAAFALKFR